MFDVNGRFYCVDLPGYGYARVSQAERRALSQLLRSYFAARGPAGVVWLLDLRRDPSPDDLAVGDLLTEHSLPVLPALTKADQVARGRRPERVRAILDGLGLDLAPEHCVVTSARTGEGIEGLRKAVERLVGQR